MGVKQKPTAKHVLPRSMSLSQTRMGEKVVVALLGHLVKEEALKAPRTEEIASGVFQDSLCGKLCVSSSHY